MILKTCFKKFPKCSHRLCSNFAIIEAIMVGTYSLKPFVKNTPGTEKHKNKKNKNIMASLGCHGDSVCNKTQIIRNFHVYIIQ